MNLDDTLTTHHLRVPDGIAPFTRDWQAALVATGRVLRDLGVDSNAMGIIGAWRSREGSVELHQEGRGTLLLDMRLVDRGDDPEDALPFAPTETRAPAPGTGFVSLGIKMPSDWVDSLVREGDDRAIAGTMLLAAQTLLGRIHLRQKGVRTETDELADIGHAFAIRAELGMTPDCGPLRIVHATPWSEAYALLKTRGEEVIVRTEAVGVRGHRLRGMLVNRTWPIASPGAQSHAPMNLVLATDETIADPKTIDPVVRLRAEAAWKAVRP